MLLIKLALLALWETQEDYKFLEIKLVTLTAIFNMLIFEFIPKPVLVVWSSME